MSRNTPLRLLPEIAQNSPKRAAQLNLTLSGLVSVLVWNFAQSPIPLEAEPADAKESRVHVPCSWRGNLRPMVRQLAKAAGLNSNAFVEALLARELRSPSAGLTILPTRGTSKPRLG